MKACRQLASTAGVLVLLAGGMHAQAPEPQRPMFRSAVDLVSVAAVVRDRHGRFVRDLTKKDFVVEEAGVPRTIEQFEAEDDAPVRVALLFDVSGSMRLASRIDDARQTARQVLAALRLSGPSADEAAVFSFDMNLQSLQPFTTDPGAIEQALSRVAPYGQTSLYDAVAQTARQVAERAPGDRHRCAVIVLTDGVDTSSEMTPAQVSGIASAIDVPVYVVAMSSDLDRPGATGTPGVAEERAGVLRSLAEWTGGDLFVTSAPAHENIAARQIVDELRHQYVLAFSAARGNGNWHALSVRVTQKNATVRARSGYTSGSRKDS